MIETAGLTRQFDGLVAVDRLDLRVPEGVLFGFLGRNGAGKTTTLKMLSTVLRPSGGAARIKGYDVHKEASEVRKLIGVVGEGVETTRPFWTPLEYLGYFLRLRGLSRMETRGIAMRWIERLELGNHRHRPIGDFSSGMRKRLELCRALCHSPELLLLDEPTKDLDIPGKREMWDLIRGLVSEEGTTVFLCSHEVAEIEALTNEIAIIRAGSLGYTGQLEDLPPSVIKITGTDPQQAASSLEQGLWILSRSASGTSLYVAPSEALAPDEVRSALESSNVAFRDVVEVQSLDERILAFL
ncbi:MAG: ABC transporter ATP-binding protein [Thermoplasmata archaeon]